MNFKTDLIDIVKCYFSAEGICYENKGDANEFAARYFEMRCRRIVTQPRVVHFSDEIQSSLGELAHEPDEDIKEKALDAWRAVFRIRNRFENGCSVVSYMSKNVKDSRTTDGLIWDYGMHHFHLSKEQPNKSGFVERSDYLLFAIVTEEHTYFVDIRKHQDPENLLWVRQDLLKIVHSNWPDLTGSSVLQGVQGDMITDIEKKELRRKNINHFPELEGHAIMPLGGGMNLAGNSSLGIIWGAKLVHEIKRHQSYFDSQPVELKTALQAKGINTLDGMKLQLVLLDSLELSPEVIRSFRADNCLSRDLSQMGFAIVESQTRLPIMVSLDNQSGHPSI